MKKAKVIRAKQNLGVLKKSENQKKLQQKQKNLKIKFKIT